MIKQKITNRIISIILLLAVLLSFVISLTSCGSFFAPKREPVTEEEFLTLSETLKENVASDALRKYSFVSSFFEHWEFPDFDEVKLKLVERYYNAYYYKDLGYSNRESVIEIAKRAAGEYIEKQLPQMSLDEINDVDVNTDAIIRAYVSAIGDKYSFYRNKKENAAYEAELSGSFAGIGVRVKIDYENNTITVLEAIEDSAAAKAGILAGDLIVAVDDVLVKDVGAQVCVDLLKGEIGSHVKVTVEREGEKLSFNMNRIAIEEESVAYELYDNGVAYVVITSFNENTDEQFIEIIDEIEKTGRVKGYIFDVRYNGGGYLDTAINLISHFVPKGTKIVSQVEKNSQQWYYSNSSHTIDLPMVVLCNGYTASAGELFTAAIRDYRELGLLNAVIVGEKTYSKGQIQNVLPIGDGSSITLTIGYFNPPCDINFDGEGIYPDREVIYIPDPKVDNQYDVAYEELLNLINKQ